MPTDTENGNRFATPATAATLILLAAFSAGCQSVPGLTMLLGGGEDYLLQGYDVICYPGQKVRLSARLQRGNRLADIAGEQIIFIDNGHEIGTAATDREGYARLDYIADVQPGHQVIHCQPAHPEIASKTRPARMLISTLPPDAGLLIVDMDRTIVQPQWLGILVGSAEPIPHAADMLNRVCSQRGLQVVYLTGRPMLLKVRSRDWLDEHGFPAGPLLLSDDLLIRAGSQSDYKIARLTELRSRFRNIRAGIGDNAGDARAYLSAGMPLALVILTAAKNDGRICRRMHRMSIDNCRMCIVNDWLEAAEVLSAE